MESNTRYWRKVIQVIILGFIILIANMVIGYNLLPFPQNEDGMRMHFSLIITTASIISGFAFTNLGILISLSNTELVRKISNTSIMAKRNITLITSIIFCCISIFIALVFVLQLDKTIIEGLIESLAPYKYKEVLKDKIISLLYINCVIFLISGIIYFVKAIKEMSYLLLKVYEANSKFSEEDIEEARRKIGKK